MTESNRFRLIAWNIRAGGGKRAHEIAKAILGFAPDIVVLSEFRSGPPSAAIANALKQAGFIGQMSTIDDVKANQNALLIASRSDLSRVRLRKRPEEPGRWLMAREARHNLAIGAMHIPNQHTGRKPGYHDAVVDLAQRWRGGPALLVGDTNSGQIDKDEEKPVFNRRTHDWFDRLQRAGWQDGFRAIHGERREYTWYSHRQNGFRLDQVFVNRALAPYLDDVCHIWPSHPDTPERRDGLSDHAALVADFAF